MAFSPHATRVEWGGLDFIFRRSVWSAVAGSTSDLSCAYVGHLLTYIGEGQLRTVSGWLSTLFTSPPCLSAATVTVTAHIRGKEGGLLDLLGPLEYGQLARQGNAIEINRISIAIKVGPLSWLGPKNY